MTDTFDIAREETATAGRYVIYLPGGLEAEMTFQKAGDVMIVDHTYTPPEFRGRDIAAKLMHRLIADARAEGTRIRPVCSYVVAQFQRHREWDDLLA